MSFQSEKYYVMGVSSNLTHVTFLDMYSNISLVIAFKWKSQNWEMQILYGQVIFDCRQFLVDY
jgi:hypothetical protein